MTEERQPLPKGRTRPVPKGRTRPARKGRTRPVPEERARPVPEGEPVDQDLAAETSAPVATDVGHAVVAVPAAREASADLAEDGRAGVNADSLTEGRTEDTEDTRDTEHTGDTGDSDSADERRNDNGLTTEVADSTSSNDSGSTTEVADTISSDDSAPPQSAVLDEAPTEAPAADGAPAEPADEHAGGLAGEAVGPQEDGTSHPVALSPWSHMSAAAKEFVVVVAMALGLSLIVKTWLMQAFYIPSGSMEDTLVLNDRVVVSKLTPGPFALHRGDIVVFADPGAWLGVHGATSRGPIVEAVSEALIFVGLLPDNSEDHLIKRVIGMPGDHVVCCDADKRITINGTAINESYLKPGNVPSATPFDITVPAGRVWVMGDHRSDSSDSRYHDPGGTGAQGSVPISLITGRAVALVWPLSHIKGLGTPDKVFAAIPPPRSAAASTATAGTQPVLAGGH